MLVELGRVPPLLPKHSAEEAVGVARSRLPRGCGAEQRVPAGHLYAQMSLVPAGPAALSRVWPGLWLDELVSAAARLHVAGVRKEFL